MAKFNNVQRIIVEDFPKEDQETVSKLGYLINNAFEQLVSLFNNGITIKDNLNESIIDVDVVVNDLGIPTTKTEFKYGLVGSCQGLMVINASNLTNTATTPTSAPFVIYQVGDNSLIRITKVLGLPANNKFKLTLRVIGSG